MHKFSHKKYASKPGAKHLLELLHLPQLLQLSPLLLAASWKQRHLMKSDLKRKQERQQSKQTLSVVVQVLPSEILSCSHLSTCSQAKCERRVLSTVQVAVEHVEAFYIVDYSLTDKTRGCCSEVRLCSGMVARTCKWVANGRTWLHWVKKKIHTHND